MSKNRNLSTLAPANTGNFAVSTNATVNGTLSTSDVNVSGNLTVTGTTVTINVSTLDVKDLNITVAKGAGSNALANGAGITVDPSNAQLFYTSSDDNWNSNKNFTFASNGSIKLPVGTTAERPAGSSGMIRFNATLTSFEGYNGTAWTSVGGGATGAGNDKIFWENGQNVTSNYTITTGFNAGTFGPVTIDNNVTVTIPANSVWTIV